MSEKSITQEQVVTKEGNLVVPLAKLRTFDHRTSVIVSGTTNILYTTGSGEDIYLRQAMFTELSGDNNSWVQLFDMGGSGLCTKIPIAADTTVVWDACPCAVGPISSGIQITSPRFAGEIALIVSIDGKRIE